MSPSLDSGRGTQNLPSQGREEGARLPWLLTEDGLRALPGFGFFLTWIFEFGLTEKAGMKAKPLKMHPSTKGSWNQFRRPAFFSG